MAKECGLFDAGCKLDNWVESTVGDAIENMANAIMEAFGKAIGSLGTVWVHIGTPNLTGTGGGSSIEAGSSEPLHQARIHYRGCGGVPDRGARGSYRFRQCEPKRS